MSSFSGGNSSSKTISNLVDAALVMFAVFGPNVGQDLGAWRARGEAPDFFAVVLDRFVSREFSHSSDIVDSIFRPFLWLLVE